MKSVRILLALAVASFCAGSLLADDKPAKTEKPPCCAAAEKEGKKCEKPCCVEAAKAGKACEHCSKK